MGEALRLNTSYRTEQLLVSPTSRGVYCGGLDRAAKTCLRIMKIASRQPTERERQK
jgi:hypothetical protein